MMRIQTNYDGVIFDEDEIVGLEAIKVISTQLNNFFGQDQLKSLHDVKRAMAREVLACGGNALGNFEYGQKNGSVWQQLFSMDNVLWYGSGIAGRLTSKQT
jgi:hypothetical protein